MLSDFLQNLSPMGMSMSIGTANASVAGSATLMPKKKGGLGGLVIG